MRLSEAIGEVNKIKPNGFDEDTLTKFVNQLEQHAYEVLNLPQEDRKILSWEEDGDKELVIPKPHDVSYLSWLKAQIDYNNEEYASYANNQAQFNADYSEFENYVVREGLAKVKPLYIKNYW